MAGILDRRGRTFAPAGRITSGVILSPTFKRTEPSMKSSRGPRRGKGLIFDPRSITTFSGLEEGGRMRLSSIKNLGGMGTRGGLGPNFLGSMLDPLKAQAMAT